MVIFREFQPISDHVNVFRGVPQPRIRVRREVSVFAAENCFAVNIFLNLHKKTFTANKRMQRIEFLGFDQLVFRKKVLTKGRLAEIDDRVLQWRAAETATAYRLTRGRSCGNNNRDIRRSGGG